MNTTKLSNGLRVLAWSRDGAAKTFVNQTQAVRNKDRLQGEGWEARVWQSPLSRVRYVVVEGRLKNDAKKALHEIQGLLNRRRSGFINQNVAMAKIERVVEKTLHDYFMERMNNNEPDIWG